jgi:hypothetical protein
MFQIRLLESLDAEIYREIRLDSLKESPESFLTTYEIERIWDRTKCFKIG